MNSGKENQAIGRWIGKEVTLAVQSRTTGGTPRGTLEAFDYPWLLLRQKDGKMYCYNVTNVILVEPDEQAGKR